MCSSDLLYEYIDLYHSKFDNLPSYYFDDATSAEVTKFLIKLNDILPIRRDY